MSVSGIGSVTLNSYLANLMYGQNVTSTNPLSSTQSLLDTTDTGNLGGSLHIELTLKDGTTLTIDYQAAGVQKKTSYEFGRYGNYTYGNDYNSSENTADRILQFASSLWDGSQSQLDTLSSAIDKGISEARQALGTIPSWLDNILTKTEDLLHKGLTSMQSQVKAAA
jgi:hypothetical protein